MKKFTFVIGLGKVEIVAKNEIEARSKLKHINQRSLVLIRQINV